MQGVAKHLLSGLERIASQGVVEITQSAKKLGVLPYLSYIFWALDTGAELPRMPKAEQAAYDLMIAIMRGTGVMPSYRSNFVIADDFAADDAVSSIALHMGRWAKQVMHSLIGKAYTTALQSQEAYVYKATGGRVSKEHSFLFLFRVFPNVLMMESRSFTRGELLWRVVNAQNKGR